MSEPEKIICTCGNELITERCKDGWITGCEKCGRHTHICIGAESSIESFKEIKKIMDKLYA